MQVRPPQREKKNKFPWICGSQVSEMQRMKQQNRAGCRVRKYAEHRLPSLLEVLETRVSLVRHSLLLLWSSPLRGAVLFFSVACSSAAHLLYDTAGTIVETFEMYRCNHNALSFGAVTRYLPASLAYPEKI